MKLAQASLSLVCFLQFTGCRCGQSQEASDAQPSRGTEPKEARAPALLYFPDGGDEVLSSPPDAAGQAFHLPRGRCPDDMVDVSGQFCIDRYEASLVDTLRQRPISPYYYPGRPQTKQSYERWQRLSPQSASALGKQMPVPAPDDWQLKEDFEPKATSRGGVIPNGYLNGVMSARACANAGKRLCKPAEWQMACRGAQGRKFPYGSEYTPGVCNVLRESHPAQLLHLNASINHTDPRLNLVEDADGRLLRPTGGSPQCRSEWGSDGAYDMVGNLDEWVEEPSGEFMGGFYSRGTKEGCDAAITAHPTSYYDYSLGVRCCR